MMRISPKPFILWTTIACFTPSFVFANTQTTDQHIKQTMQNFMKRNRIHGAAVILSHHGVLKTYVFGEAVPQKHIPVTENTIFELGSVTKTFTGALLAKSVMAGQTGLSEPIQHYLDKPHSFALGKITYLDLATHSSGLPFNARNLPYNAPSSSLHLNRFHYTLKSQSTHFRNGTQMLYSNFGYGILGRVLANKERTSLNELMQRNILSPLNMHSSGLDIHVNQQKYLAQGYDAIGRPVPYRASGLLAGAWAMRASVKDMGSYLQAALGNAKSSAHVHQAIRFAQVPYYNVARERMQMGLGWVITPLQHRNAIKRLITRPEHYHFVPVSGTKIANPRFNGHAVIGKTGATDGFRAYIAMIPEKDTGIVIMTNQFFHQGGKMTSMANQMLLAACSGLG